MIHPVAINPSYALLAGHDEGGTARGGIASLFETTKVNGVDLMAAVLDGPVA